MFVNPPLEGRSLVERLRLTDGTERLERYKDVGIDKESKAAGT